MDEAGAGGVGQRHGDHVHEVPDGVVVGAGAVDAARAARVVAVDDESTAGDPGSGQGVRAARQHDRADERRVARVAGHADRERDVGEVPVGGLLGPVGIAELDAAGWPAEVQVGVAQGEHGVGHRPRQHHRQRGDGDVPATPGLPARLTEREAHGQEAHEARADQQQAGRAPGLVLARDEIAGARPVGSGDDRPDRDEEHQRAGVPARDQGQLPGGRRQQDEPDRQPDGRRDDKATQRRRVPAQPAVVDRRRRGGGHGERAYRISPPASTGTGRPPRVWGNPRQGLADRDVDLGRQPDGEPCPAEPPQVVRRPTERRGHVNHLDGRPACEDVEFEATGGRFLRGEGRIVVPGRVAVDDREIVARRAIVIATGTHPSVPPIEGLGRVPYGVTPSRRAAPHRRRCRGVTRVP